VPTKAIAKQPVPKKESSHASQGTAGSKESRKSSWYKLKLDELKEDHRKADLLKHDQAKE
jgi:hypothetical protein